MLMMCDVSYTISGVSAAIATCMAQGTSHAINRASSACSWRQRGNEMAQRPFHEQPMSTVPTLSYIPFQFIPLVSP